MSFRLSRRAMIRGAGSIAIALPWLEIMGRSRPARAQSQAARRFVAVYQPGGTVRDEYTPTGSEDAPLLSPILAPLQPILDKKKLLIVDGLDMNSAVGEQHQAGIITWLTGTKQADGGSGYAEGPSIDQVLANRLNAEEPRARKSIELAIRWATGKSKGLLSPMNTVNFEDNGQFSPIPPRLDPVQIFSDLFGSLMPDDGHAATLLAQKKSVLDYVDRRYDALAKRLGASDRQRLEQHLTKIREIENALSNMVPPSPVCVVPEPVDTSGYDPRTGLNSSDNGDITDVATDTVIPKVGTYMMDMLVMALACDITAVGTLQWTDTEAKHTFPWLSLAEHHHYYQHDGGFRPDECAKIGAWYSEMHCYLLNALDAVELGGHTLLDETVVFFGSELCHPPNHNKDNMPFLLGGAGGGLRGGRWVDYGGKPHNHLLVSLMNLFGDDRDTFGDPEYGSGGLANLV
jgi:hypothetical protein